MPHLFSNDEKTEFLNLWANDGGSPLDILEAAKVPDQTLTAILVHLRTSRKARLEAAVATHQSEINAIAEKINA